MDEVAKWLADLGLRQFAAIFARAEIDLASLRLLSDQDLQELQIPLGPRKKIAAAIKLLNDAGDRDGQPGTSTDRRQITALFCDLVGSTEYAVQMDPEDFGKLTQLYFDRCGRVITNRNGMVVTSVGDALLALFGYPIAGEDDPDRALEAALDLLQAVPCIDAKPGPPLQVRIGVASGLAVVGTYLAAPNGSSTFAFGPIPSLAQRLQTLAAPQTVLVDNQTHSATAGAFEFTDTGLHSLKGFAEPVRAWRVERTKLLESRFAKKTRLFKLVGRNAQLQALLKQWEGVVATGHGKVIVLSGEPGIGKSRLAFEVQKQVPQCTPLALQCSPAFSNSALLPFLNLLKRYTGIRDEEPGSVKVQKLDAILAMSDVPTAVALPIFARLLSIDISHLPHSELSSLRQQSISRRVLVDWIHGISKFNPVLMVFEDAQWIDPSSRDVLDALIDEARSHAVMMLITSRGPPAKPWPTARHLSEMALERLTRQEAEGFVLDVAGSAAMTEELRANVLSKAEGVPLFIEELTRAALDTGLPSEQWEQNAGKPVPGVPRSLQSSLVSRLDKLGSAKAIVQAAAVIGREFDLTLLAHICDVSSGMLERTMERLTESGLVAPQLSPGPSRYAFTHALLQEAARGTLLRERREELHGMTAHAIESLHPKVAADHPELLAQHFEEAGMLERAADCWLAGGLNVAKTWAKVEAANMFSMGLACLERLPASVEHSRKALRLELERGDVLYATFGFITPAGSSAYRNAMSLSRQLEDSEAPIRALDGLFGTAFNSAKFSDAEWASDQLIEIGTKGKSVKALVLGLQFKGMSLFCGGHFKRARRYLDRSLHYDAQADLVGSDFPSMAMLYLSWTLQILGLHNKALELFVKAERITRMQSAYRLAACLGNGCILFALQDNPQEIRQITDELIPLSKDNGFNLWLNMGYFFEGWCLGKTANDPSGLARMQNICNDLGEQEIDKSCYLGLLAEAYLRAGQLGSALETVQQGLKHVKSTGERYFEAELIRLSGEVQFRLDKNPAIVEQLFREADTLSRQQGARFWEARVASSFASLRRSLGRKRKGQSGL